MASANFTVNGNAVPPEIAVSAGSLVTLALLSTSGVDTVEWRIIGNHSPAAVNPAITPAGTPLGATATFTMPAGSSQAYLIQCTINGGVDSEGVEQSSYVKTALVGVLNAAGFIPLAFGETFERSLTHGYIAYLNALANAIGGGGGTSNHSLLTNLTADDHLHYELARRPLQDYTAASNDLALADARRCVTSTRATAIALRIRLQSAVTWLSETLLGGINVGAGTLTITAEGGVTINGVLNGSVTVPSNGWWWAKRTALNTWQVFTGASGDIKSDGSVPYTGNQSLGGNKLTSLGNGSLGSQDAAPVAQVEALIAAAVSSVADWKQSVRAATTAALPTNTRSGNVLTASANGALAVQDGVTLVLNDRLLAKDEATGANRGIYTVTALGSAGAPWQLTRATDADTSAEVTSGMTCVVEEGSANAGKVFILTTPGTITLNTTALSFSAIGTLSADGTTLTLSGSTLSVAAGGVGATQLASNAVTTPKIAAANVTLAKLATDACPQYRAVANAAARTGLAAGERNAGMLVRENDTGLLYVLAADLTTWVLADTSTTNQTISRASADAVGAEIKLRKARGSEASPAAVAADDVLAARTAQGHDGSVYYDAGSVDHVADAAGGTSKRTRARARLHDGTAVVTTEEAVAHRVTTTDATLTVVRSIPLAADSVHRVRYGIVGAQSASSNRAIRETSVTVRRSGSGDPVIVGSADNIPLFKDDATWGADTEIGHQINTTTDALEIIVKGKAATTIRWNVDIVWSAR
jgi:hypothetical protein